MLNLKNEKLKIRCKTNADYHAFISFVADFQDRIKKEYDFLCLSDLTWDNLFNTGLNKYIEKEIVNFSNYIIKTLNTIIKKDYENKNFQIIKNLLLKLKKDSTGNLLLAFFKKLKSFGIELDEEYFEILMKEIPLFKQLLEQKYLTTYREFQCFTEGKYDIYYALKNPYHTLEETIDLVDYFIFLIPGLTLEQLTYNKTTPIFKKIKFLIVNYQNLEKLREIYIAKFGSTPKAKIDKTILDFSLNEITQIFNDLIQYCNAALESNKDALFLHRIYNRIEKSNANLGHNQEKTPKKNNNRPKNTNQSKETELNKEKIIELLLKNNKFISIFDDWVGITSSRKRELVRVLLSEESIEELKLIHQTICENKKRGIVSPSLQRLQRLYLKIIEEEYLKKITKIILSDNTNLILAIFPSHSEIPDVKRFSLIYELIEKETVSNIKQLIRYLKKDPNSTPEDIAKSQNIRRSLVNKYKRRIDALINTNPYKSLYKYFPNYTGIPKSRKIAIIDAMLQEETSEEVANLISYSHKKSKSNSEEDNQALILLTNIKLKYRALIASEPKATPKETIYDYFPDYPQISLEEKMRRIDLLLNALPPMRKQNVLALIEGTINPKTTDEHKAKIDIKVMQKQYKRSIEKYLLIQNSLNDICLYLPNIAGVSENLKQEKCQILFEELPTEIILDIMAFLHNKVDTSSSKAERIKNYLLTLEKNYLELIGQKVSENNALYSKIKLEIADLSDEAKKMAIDAIFKTYSSDKQKRINDYLSGKLKSTTSEGEKAAKEIFHMTKQVTNYLLTKKLPQKRHLDLEERFPDIIGIPPEQKSEIISILIKRLSINRQNNIMAYITKQECDSNKAKNDLIILKKQYKSFTQKYILAPHLFTTKDPILYCALLVQNLTGIDLLPNLNLSKILLLNDALHLIEYQYRSQKEIKREEYLKYLETKITEIITLNETLDLESIIITYINLASQELVPKRDTLKK